MPLRLIIAIAIDVMGLAGCFYSEKVWTVAPWTVLVSVSFLWIGRSLYRSGKATKHKTRRIVNG